MISSGTIADLHIHSCASDSTDTPLKIIRTLLDKDIGIASLTDHNTIDNQKTFLTLAKKHGIKAIPGVEVSTKIGDMVYHILAYGYNPDDERVNSYVSPILAMMKDNNRNLIKKMAADHAELNLDEYDEYTYDRTRGGWEFVNYIFDKGITIEPIDGLAFYNTYNCRLSNCPYPTPGEAIKEILSWGAYPVLAHPNGYFREENPSIESIVNLFDKLKAMGLMGIECYYPSHSDIMTDTSIEWCKQNNMIITAGCDSHGGFVPGRGIGKLRISLSELNINILLKENDNAEI